MINRIYDLRKKQGLTLAQLAELTNSTPQQIGRLEKGERRLTTDWMQRLAKALNVMPQDIMTDQNGEKVIIPHVEYSTTPDLYSKTQKQSGVVQERAFDDKSWVLPKDVVHDQIGSNSSVRIVQVLGDSMKPEFLPGDRIMVNIADRTLSPPGAFILWDGFGLIIKRCEMIPYSNPPRAILSSTNPNYATYEMEIKDLDIRGRVVGKWLWT